MNIALPLDADLMAGAPQFPPLSRAKLLELRLEAIASAQEHLITYARLVKPWPGAEDDPRRSLYLPAKHHIFIANKLEEVANRTVPRLIITAPPRSGKTELTSKLFPAWFAGRFAAEHLVLATYNESFSRDFGRAVKDYVRSPAHRQVFPSFGLKTGRASSTRLETLLGGVQVFTGVGGSITGRGGSILIGDDLIKSKEQADSAIERQKAWDWYNAVFRTRMMDERAAMLLICTRWHEDDIVGRITDPDNPFYQADEAAMWQVINLPAIALGDDPLGREPGEVLWPARFGLDFLESQQRSDPRVFAALYQGTPAAVEGNFIRADWIHTYRSLNKLPSNLRIYMSMDLAVSKEQQWDRSCIIPIGVDHKDNIWVLPGIWWQRAEADVLVESIVKMILKHEPMILWGEKGVLAKSIGPFLRKRMLERGAFTLLEETAPRGDKQMRAMSIIGRMHQRKVFFPDFAPWWPAALNEMLKFPAGTRDDFVDAMAIIGQGMQRMATASVKTPSNHAKEGTFGYMKEQEKRATRMFSMASKGSQGW